MTHFSEDLCVCMYVCLCVFACAGMHTHRSHLLSAFVCVLHVWLHWFSESIAFICSSCEEGGNTDEERD